MADVWRIIVKGALVCGVGGPAMGVVFFVLVGILWPGGPPAVRPDQSRLTAVLAGIVVYWLYAIVFLGPVAGLFGALGTWLVLQAHRHAMSLNLLRTIGVVTGAVLGALCPGLSIAIISMSLGSSEAVTKAGYIGWVDPRNPFTLLGAVVGAILGFVVAVLVVRRVAALPRPLLQHPDGRAGRS